MRIACALTLSLSKVASRGLGRLSSDANTLDDDGGTADASNLDIDAVGTEASRVLEEVVLLAGSSLPGCAAVGGDLELADADVGVHDLHAEPVLAGALLVLENDGGGDAAGDDVPGHGDLTLGGLGELGEGVGEQVKVVGAAARALVNDHSCDLVAVGSCDGHAGTAGVGAVPVAVGECGAVEVGGDSVAGEGAHAARDVAAVEGSFALLRAGSGGSGVFHCLCGCGCDGRLSWCGVGRARYWSLALGDSGVDNRVVHKGRWQDAQGRVRNSRWLNARDAGEPRREGRVAVGWQG